jgi:hypothetical protein
MLASWMNVLPLFIVKWLARKHGERIVMGSMIYVSATNGVWIRLYE